MECTENILLFVVFTKLMLDMFTCVDYVYLTYLCPVNNFINNNNKYKMCTARTRSPKEHAEPEHKCMQVYTSV